MIKSGNTVRVNKPLDDETMGNLHCKECDQRSSCFLYGNCTMTVKDVGESNIVFDTKVDELKCKYLEGEDDFELAGSWVERMEVVE